MIVPTFGVVIPCYNQPKLMIRALYSVLAQTVASEVGVTIVSDGGTLAGQPEWLRVASTFENVTVLWTKNNGPGAARNAAIEWLLKTYPQIEYVFFLDADNRLEPWALETARRLLRESGRQWLYSDIHSFGIRKFHNAVASYNPHIHLFKNYCDCGCLIDADILRAGVRFNSDRREGYEDWGFWLSALEQGSLGAHSDDFGFRYRRRGASRLHEENKKRSLTVDILHENHRELYDFKRVKSLENTYAPRFCVIKAGANDGYFLSDPLHPGEAYSSDDIKGRFWAFADRPDQETYPPYTVIVHPSLLESKALSHLLRDFFLRIDHELRRHTLLVGHISFGGDVLKIEPITNEEEVMDQVVFVAVGSKTILYILRAGDLTRVHQLSASSETRHWKYEIREEADFVEQSDLVSVGLITHMSTISDRGFKEQSKLNWNWKQPFFSCFLPEYAGWTSDLDSYCLPDLQEGDGPSIAFVIKICDFGGAEKVIFNVARQLAESGCRVNLFVYGSDTIRSPEQHLRAFENIYFFDQSYQDDRECPSWGGGRIFRGVPIPTEGDVVNQNLASALSAMDVVVNANNQTFNALVSQLHHQGVVTATYLHTTDQTTWGQAWGHPFQALAFEHAYDLMITCSESLCDWLAAAGVPREKCCFVRNAPGFPIDQKVDKERPISPNRPLRILYAGRFDRQKGIDRIALLRRATAKHCDWRIFGSPIIHDTELIMENTSPAIYDEQKLQEQYAWADIMLLLSEYEGVPLGILEAQQAGCVVISTDVGAVSEAITDGVDGFLVPLDDYFERTIDIIGRLDGDRQLMAGISAAARKRIADHSWASNTEPLIQRLETLVLSRRLKNKSSSAT